MNRLLLLGALTLLYCPQGFAAPVEDWGAFEVCVRDQTITKAEAKKRFAAIYGSLTGAAPGGLSSAGAEKWVFPVAGCSKKDAGRKGFRPGIRYGSSPVKGYDFYDGNRHGGHPAYDIFIRDRDRDSRDDGTGRSVPVVAPVDLMVLSIHTGWQPGSLVRGGNYLWALYPPEGLLLYFAHCDSIKAVPGEVCRAGDTLGTVGRTGANAAPARSPTHLHLMALRVMGHDLAPYDYWKRLPGR